jgi:hypothetical protein
MLLMDVLPLLRKLLSLLLLLFSLREGLYPCCKMGWTR